MRQNLGRVGAGIRRGDRRSGRGLARINPAFGRSAATAVPRAVIRGSNPVSCAAIITLRTNRELGA
ncbi:MAG: hypothetical protein ACREFO_04100 [Acetobacteraceae bacterium]